MEHSEFVDKLESFGFQIRSTNYENRTREFKIPRTFGVDTITDESGKLKWKDYSPVGRDEPLNKLLQKAIDTPSWSHSWHLDIKPKNYEKIKEIIQKRLIGLASDADEILAIYFLLNKEMSENHKS